MAYDGRLSHLNASEDDVDDFTFLQHPRQGTTGYAFGGGLSNSDDGEDKRRRQMMLVAEEKERIQRRTLESSARSLGLVHESEQIGVATAEELMAQREQLENCETKVSDVNRSLRQSQKHINSIKSIFGGFVNRFSRNSVDADAGLVPTNVPTSKKPSSGGEPSSEPRTSNSLLSSVVGETKNNPTYNRMATREHPALRLRNVDYDSSSTNKSTNPFDEEEEKEESVVGGVQMEQQLNQNLDHLGLGLARLKGLAMGLGDEIEEQNAMLDRLGNSVDRADLGIQRQNKQMNKILKK